MFGIGRKKRARRLITGYGELLHEMAAEENDMSLSGNVVRWEDDETDIEVLFPKGEDDIGIMHTSKNLPNEMIHARRIYFTYTGIIAAINIILTSEEAATMSGEMFELYAQTDYELDPTISDDDMAYFFQILQGPLENTKDKKANP